MFRSILFTILALVSPLALPLSATPLENIEGQAKPLNVMLFFVDDLSWTDVGCFGSPLYQTRHIDSLALSGVRFTGAHAPDALLYG